MRGTEEVLTKIENEWERVSLQTNWKIEPVLRFQPTTDGAESESQSSTVSAESPSETTSQSFLGGD